MNTLEELIEKGRQVVLEREEAQRQIELDKRSHEEKIKDARLKFLSDQLGDLWNVISPYICDMTVWAIENLKEITDEPNILNWLTIEFAPHEVRLMPFRIETNAYSINYYDGQSSLNRITENVALCEALYNNRLAFESMEEERAFWQIESDNITVPPETVD